MATDAATLLSEGRCYYGCAGVSTADALELQLLAQISLIFNSTMATDASSLLYQARCLGCSSGASIAEQMKLALLAQISASLGTGGGGTFNRVYSGDVPPNGVQTGIPGDIYNEIAGGVFVAQWTKITGTGNTGWQ